MRKIALSLLCISLLNVAPSWARINLFTPLSTQDRAATRDRLIDQSFAVQFGKNGFLPSGQASDSDFVQFPYQISYGWGDKLEVGGSWGLTMTKRPAQSSQFGVNDFTAGAKYRLFEANRAERTPGLDVEAALAFPTGNFNKGTGTGGLGLLVSWGLVLPLDPARAQFWLGYRHNTENSDDVQVGGVFSYGGGFGIPVQNLGAHFAGAENFHAMAEVKGFNHARNKRQGNAEGETLEELYLSPGLRYLGGLKNLPPIDFSLLLGLTSASSDVGASLEVRF